MSTHTSSKKWPCTCLMPRLTHPCSLPLCVYTQVSRSIRFSLSPAAGSSFPYGSSATTQPLITGPNLWHRKPENGRPFSNRVVFTEVAFVRGTFTNSHENFNPYTHHSCFLFGEWFFVVRFTLPSLSTSSRDDSPSL